MISGYNRDFQLIKKSIVEANNLTLSSIKAINVVLENIKPNKESIKDKFKSDIIAADIATKMSVEEGIPFRDAYKKVMTEVDFDKYDLREIINSRVSLGSPGNY